ncbi:hypothetical protein NQ314_011638 [Rhamnusium bicolor]|uniref:Uncharacterized protein n=1 Tax=Rhamnusium bicolor TaxID=1586634 RepID=A0AAV8XHD8_9CUCU|nr:hypothetical protein NQ314_011638 [Rhamnusium bicolor]
MASTLLYTLVCFTVTIALGSCQNLSCYDCDPRNFGVDCGRPAENNVRSVPCYPEVENGTAVCLSAYFNFTGERINDTGIYRGCKTLRPDVSDFCDWFRQETNALNLTVTSCASCNTTRCNVIKFNPDGTSSAEITSTAIFMLVLNTIFVLLLTGFD